MQTTKGMDNPASSEDGWPDQPSTAMRDFQIDTNPAQSNSVDKPTTIDSDNVDEQTTKYEGNPASSEEAWPYQAKTMLSAGRKGTQCASGPRGRSRPRTTSTMRASNMQQRSA